jgi:hypothetical protein
MTGFKSLGIVGVVSKLGSMIEVKRIPARYFETSDQAERHGLKLAKQWVDDHAKDRSSE